MGEVIVRLIVVVAVVVVAAGIAFLSRRTITYHPQVDIARLGLPPGLVIFTSTECQRCKQALAVAKTFDVPLREVTYELEADLQEQVGVVGVPLTLVIDISGRLVAQLAGRLSPRAVRRAVARAGF